MKGNQSSTPTLWPFALEVYRLPGVAAACLVLQDAAKANVPMLLWALWIGAKGQLLSDADLTKAKLEVLQWHQEIIEPLRALRRRIKTGPSPAPSEETEALREQLKSVEIVAEKIEMDLLELNFHEQGADPTNSTIHAMQQNLVKLLGKSGEHFPHEINHIVTSAQALMQSHTGST